MGLFLQLGISCQKQCSKESSTELSPAAPQFGSGSQASNGRYCQGSGEWLMTGLDPSIYTLESLTHTPGGLLRSRFCGAARKRAPYFTWRMETKKLWGPHAAGTSAHRLWTSLITNQPLE